MMQKIIYYWEAIIGQEALVSEYSEKLRRLLSGEYKGLSLGLKKLPGCRLYSIRLNDSDRLLFTLLTSSDGKTYLVLLEKVPNHDYQKSRFLKPNVLKQFLETQGDMILKQIQETDFKDIDHLPCTTSQADQEELSFLKVEYYKDTFIALNEQQAGAANCYSALPLIISGPPGAGKSCVALTILSQCSEQHAESDKPILLVTRNTHLKTNLATIFAATHPHMDPKRIHIRTYNELLTDLVGNVLFAGKDDFHQWLNQYVENHAFPAKKLPSMDAIYNEFGIINVCEANYMQLGANAALFADPLERKWLLYAYQDYHDKHLATRVNPDFYALPQKSLYACIVADESQNFSPRQLQVLVALANGQNCFCLDTNQATEDVQSKRAFIIKLFYELQKKVVEKQLPVAYRCPLQVNRVVNALLKTKYKLTGGKVDKHQYGLIELAATQARQGSIQWWEPELSSERKRILNELTGSVNFAIVTLPEFIEEIRTIVNTPLIFTPNQVGGLEYNTILAYRLFDHEKFKEINKKLALIAEDEDEKEIINRPKNKDMRAMLDAPQFNEVFIAFTRACENLIICQADKHEIKYVLAPIRKEVIESAGKAIAMPESSTAEWEEHINLQLASGNTEQAKLIQEKLDNNSIQDETMQSVMSSSSSSSQPYSSNLSNNPAKRASRNPEKKPQKDRAEPLAVTNLLFALPQNIEVMGSIVYKGHDYRLKELIGKPTKLTILCMSIVAALPESWCPLFIEIWNRLIAQDVKYLRTLSTHKEATEILNSTERGKIFLRIISLFVNEINVAPPRLISRRYAEVYTRLLQNKFTDKIKFEDFEIIAHTAVKNLASRWVFENKPCDVVKDGRSHTMLHSAAFMGDAAVAEVLCYYHTNIDQLNLEGCSALYLATIRGHLPVVELLLRRGAFPHHHAHPCKPLLVATLQASQSDNHYKVLKSLLGTKMLKLFPIDCYTLFAAAASSDQRVLDAVLSAGCNPKQLDPQENRNALFSVAESGNPLSADKLVSMGCNPNHEDMNGCRPLAIAIANGRLDLVDIFLPFFEMSQLNKFKLTRLGFKKLYTMSTNVHSLEFEEKISSKYTLDNHVCITPLELATELKQEAIRAQLLLLALEVPQLATAVTSQTSVPPQNLAFFTTNSNLQETIKKPDDYSRSYSLRKE